MPKDVLDNLDSLRKIDKNNMLQFCTDSSKHYCESEKNAAKVKLAYPVPENIVIAGMGGSAIGGEIVKDYIRDSADVPIEISREYCLPKYAGKKTLTILASYSGDTEETLASLLDALKRGCMIFCLSSDGALLRFAQRLSLPHLKVAGGMPPRGALPHMLMPLLHCLKNYGWVPNLEEDFSEATRVLQKVSKENSALTPSADNPAKVLAMRIEGTTPVIYGFGIHRGVALRFKQQFNENAKIPAKWEVFSELNHNDTMGWEKPGKLGKSYSVVFVRDKAEPHAIRTRIETTQALMKPTVPRQFEIWAEGKSSLARILSAILVGDFASVYLACLRQVDPTPVCTVSVMKQKIEKNGVKDRILEQLEELSKGG